ncbi:MAG: transporter substrate-binding domain-containing protein [Burkholderiales bacterium]|nr:transporter substrate-binding domain-containing protein [Burkholderiales bacterium]
MPILPSGRLPGAPISRFAAVAVAAVLSASAFAAVPALDVEYVIANPRPKVAEVGYVEPEVFDPFTDRLYQGGFRYGGPPVEIPQEARYLSAIGRTKMLKRILACADAWYYPFSHTAPKAEPPGIDIEILSRIAQRNGWEFSVMWANTGVYRGGVNKAFKETVNRGFCDVFMGLVITGDDDHMLKNDMAFTRPYLGIGFVLVGNGKVPKVRTLEELRGTGIKVGVPAYSPMQDNAEKLGIPYVTYFQNNRVIDGLLRKEVDAIMVWGPSIPVANREKNVELAMSAGFQPVPGQRFNGAWAVKAKETEFKQLIDEAFTQMLASGEMKQIVEKYGVPFFAPFPEGQ